MTVTARAMDVGLGNIRGAAVDEFLGWYSRERDPKRLSDAARSLPSHLAAKVRWDEGAPRLIPFAWYPCELVHGIFDALLGDLDATGRERLCREVADYVMDATLHGVYKSMFKAAMTPSLLAKISPRLWRLYYDTGDNQVDIDAHNVHRATLRGWRGHHPFLCEVNRFAGEWIYRQLKCQRVRSQQTACVGRGDPCCIVVTSWL
jgi:hypothetical protein